jgi:hypothetical protein
MAALIHNTVRAGLSAAVGLVIATAGMSSIASGASPTSPLRISVAAGILSVYASLVAIMVTDRGLRTRPSCLLWGGLVPLLVGVANVVLVALSSGLVTGLISGVPWLAGPLLVTAVGPRLPAVRRPAWLRRRANR